MSVSATEIDDGGDELALNPQTDVPSSERPNVQLSDRPNVLASDSNSSVYLVLDNDADKENIEIGDEVVWDVSVINLANNTAKNVKVFDQLPDGLKYIKHYTTKGTFNPLTGIWDIGDLSMADGEVFLYITTLALTNGEKINKAYLTTDSINLNPETFEEEEIDVGDVDDDDDDDDKSVEFKSSSSAKSVATGNPLALMLLSLLAVFTASFRKFKK